MERRRFVVKKKKKNKATAISTCRPIEERLHRWFERLDGNHDFIPFLQGFLYAPYFPFTYSVEDTIAP